MNWLNNRSKYVLSVVLVVTMVNYSLIIASSSPVATTATIIEPIVVIGGTQGSQPEQFNEPDAVVVSDDGTIFAADTLNLRIQVFDKNGTYLRNITGFADVSLNEVQGMAFNSLGELCVIDMFDHKVRIFDPNGTQVDELGFKGTSDGGFQEPQGLAIDSENRLYIVDTQRNVAIIYDRNGTFIAEFGSTHLGAPESILIDETNSRIFVCSEEAGKIIVFDYEDYSKITEFGATGLGSINDDPEGIVLDSDGNLILVDEGAGRISVFFSNLTYYHSFGETGSGNGYFNSPDGVAFDHNNQRLIVADQGNYRLQVFNWTEVMEEFSTLPTETTTTATSEEQTSGETTPGFLIAPLLIAAIFVAIKKRK